jgi:hypothetical protein
VGTCDECGGVRYPNPHANGRFANCQPCQACTPSVQIGAALRGSEDARSGEQVRQREARIVGAKTYTSVNRCPICHGVERFTVGQRCVVCVTAEYADAPTLPLPIIVAKATPKPKPVAVVKVKPVAVVKVKPIKPPADRHRPKSEQHRAAIAAAAWRRYHPESSSHEPVTSR